MFRCTGNPKIRLSFVLKEGKGRDPAGTPIKTGKEKTESDGLTETVVIEEKRERAGSCGNRRPGVGGWDGNGRKVRKSDGN